MSVIRVHMRFGGVGAPISPEQTLKQAVYMLCFQLDRVSQDEIAYLRAMDYITENVNYQQAIDGYGK
jgi:hypothetical protein